MSARSSWERWWVDRAGAPRAGRSARFVRMAAALLALGVVAAVTVAALGAYPPAAPDVGPCRSAQQSQAADGGSASPSTRSVSKRPSAAVPTAASTALPYSEPLSCAASTASPAPALPAPSATSAPGPGDAPPANAPSEASVAASTDPTEPLPVRREPEALRLASSPTPSDWWWKLPVTGLVIAAGVWVIRKRGKLGHLAARKEGPVVVGRVVLGGRREILAVEIDGRRMALGVTPTGITWLGLRPTEPSEKGGRPAAARGVSASEPRRAEREAAIRSRAAELSAVPNARAPEPPECEVESGEPADGEQGRFPTAAELVAGWQIAAGANPILPEQAQPESAATSPQEPAASPATRAPRRPQPRVPRVKRVAVTQPPATASHAHPELAEPLDGPEPTGPLDLGLDAAPAIDAADLVGAQAAGLMRLAASCHGEKRGRGRSSGSVAARRSRAARASPSVTECAS